MKLRFLTLLAVLLLLVPVAAAQDMMTPSVTVADQVSTDGMVIISSIVSDGPGWLVIHADNGEGRPGPVIGYRAVNDGETESLAVSIDTSMATPTLFAMLHSDTGEVGVYEFGQVEGADGPVRVDDAVITPAFNAEILRAYDQYVDMGMVNVAAVVVSQDGFVVIHAAGENGGPGPVIGFAPVSAGTSTDVMVQVDEAAVTPTIFPMLHVDTGEAGTYEFGQVEGADGPVVIDGTVAVTGITVNQPSMRVPDQIVTDMVTAESVVSEGAGWLVIHAAGEEGGPGPVIGFAAVEAGTNTDVMVEVDPAGVTPTLFPMLHVDTGEAGAYEFGQVEGADGPVRVNDSVLVFPINAAPAIDLSEGRIDGEGTLMINWALIDAQGWLVIHADNGEGGPGPVIGYAPLAAGLNENIQVSLDAAGITETIFPMLHYDTGEAGVYEFGQVEGADGPVRVGDAVVVGPLTPARAMN